MRGMNDKLFQTRDQQRIVSSLHINKIFVHVSFCSRFLTWDLNHAFASNKTTHYHLDYGALNFSVKMLKIRNLAF